MRDYDREEILMHYGIPNMKRPRGLKYKTRKISNSLYQHRQDQMHPNTESDDDRKPGNWTDIDDNRRPKRWKLLNDTKTKVSESNPSDSYYQSRTAKKNAPESRKYLRQNSSNMSRDWNTLTKGATPTEKKSEVKKRGDMTSEERAKNAVNSTLDRLGMGRQETKKSGDVSKLRNRVEENVKRSQSTREGSGKNGKWTYEDAHRKRYSRLAGPHKKS